MKWGYGGELPSKKKVSKEVRKKGRIKKKSKISMGGRKERRKDGKEERMGERKKGREENLKEATWCISLELEIRFDCDSHIQPHSRK